MPELPEVETVKRALEQSTVGGAIGSVETSGKAMRWPIPKDLGSRIGGGRIAGYRRRGKYILADILAGRDGDLVMLIHLGMSGSVRIHPAGAATAARPHDHLVLGLGDGQRVVLNDPRRFGGVALIAPGGEPSHKLLKGLGVEPFGNELSGEYLRGCADGRRSSVKALLMDQRVVAGIGNIYASEALFAAGISPLRQAGRIGAGRFGDLALSIREVMQRAIDAGGTSLRDHVQPGGEIGYFAQELRVYGREGEPCTVCGRSVRMVRQTGRASFYCPGCQH